MPILRKGLNDYAAVSEAKAKKSGATQHHPDDFDLGFGTHKIYILDAHEYWDPRTGRDGRHAMYGPGVIVFTDDSGGLNTNEYHVNDPSVWAYIRRCIAEGHLTAEKMTEGPPVGESNVSIS